MKRAIHLIIIGVIIVFGFSKCATTNKTKSITKTSIDSTSVVKLDSSVVKSKDSTTVKKDNTVTTIEKEDNYVKETVIEFEPVKSDTKAADYFPVIKKTTIKETGIKKEKSTTAANKIDSTALKSTEDLTLIKKTETQVITTATIKNKHVERTSYWWLLWFLLLIPAYLVYRNWDKIKALV